MATVPSLDPEQPQTLPQRWIRALIRTRFGTALARTTAARVDPWLLKKTNGRFSTGFGFRSLNLTTTGRKSGGPRTTTLIYFTTGDDVVLVASSFGRDKHPAWYLNLKANPEAELWCRGRRGGYVAREAAGEERDHLFDLATKLYPGYARYAAGTDRRIPVMVLSPVTSPKAPATR